jgi:predicted TPR repeat methyltransferase
LNERLGREYFEGLYAESGDPWGFETSEYERNKYARTLAALGERRFRRGLEAGASIGVFTEMLADRCDELLAVDVSERAVAEARRRLSGRGHVTVERRTLPEEMPGGPFDLIVASEVLYYFPGEEMLAVLRGFERELARGGSLLAVHWRRETKTYPLQGDEVHELLAQNTRLRGKETIIEPDYRLDLYEDVG